MPNLRHCNFLLKSKHWDIVIAIGKRFTIPNTDGLIYPKIIIYRFKCPGCNHRIRAWRGVMNDGSEHGALIKIKPKETEKFQELISRYRINSSSGNMVVKSQKKYDGIPLKSVTLEQIK